jgi:hypothetical protein
MPAGDSLAGMTAAGSTPAGPRPALAGRRVRLRPGRARDALRLHAILGEPSVSRWWGEPDPVAVIEEDLQGSGSAVMLVVEIEGEAAGGIQYDEEQTPEIAHDLVQVRVTALRGGAGTHRGAGRLPGPAGSPTFTPRARDHPAASTVCG